MNTNPIAQTDETPFIEFTSDYGFKATFGNESDTRFLRKALQALIQSEVPIESVEFVKTDFQGTTLDGRGGVYDLACVDGAGNHFIVEMQVSGYPRFLQRMKFYAFQKFNIMVKKGHYRFNNLTKIYCIGILAENIYPYEQYYNFGQTTNQFGQIMDDQITYITVELDKFHKSISDITTDLEKLLFTMKNLKTYAEAPPTQFPMFWTEEWLQVAIKELDTRRFTPEQYERYNIILCQNALAIDLEQQRVDAATAIASVEAMEKGMEKGAQLAEMNAILKLSSKGKLADEIADLLDIDIVKVNHILNQPKQ
jgi:predicted transposase/invertase (TIGR01784 family)